MTKMERATDELFRRMLSDTKLLASDFDFALERLSRVQQKLDVFRARLERMGENG